MQTVLDKTSAFLPITWDISVKATGLWPLDSLPLLWGSLPDTPVTSFSHNSVLTNTHEPSALHKAQCFSDKMQTYTRHKLLQDPEIQCVDHILDNNISEPRIMSVKPPVASSNAFWVCECLEYPTLFWLQHPVSPKKRTFKTPKGHPFSFFCFLSKVF